MQLIETLAWTGERGWLKWSGKVWEQVKTPEAVEVVRLQLLAMFNAIVTEPTTTDAQRKAAMRLLGKPKAAAVLYFLEGLLHVPAEKWDAHPDYLNVKNGVVHLATGDLGKHEARFRFTKIAAARYMPYATHADWEMALEAVPEDVRDWLQVRYGQAATGHRTSDDVLPLQQGSGSNGKSTLVDAIADALGDHAVYVPEKVLLANPNEHPTDLMTLHGARLAIIEELPEGRHLPTKRLKDLVGTKRMTARLMRQDFVSWDATHSLVVNTNYTPLVAETDHGTWRRLALVTFPYRFIHPSEPKLLPNDRHGDPGIRERMQSDRAVKEAVLSWIVEGAKAWYAISKEMPPVPLRVQEDTEAWRDEADVIMAYARQHLTFDPDSMVMSTELFADFSDWLSDKKRSPWSDQTFASRFGGHDLAEENKVKKGLRSIDPKTLSRRHGNNLSTPPPKRATCWVGVKFAKVETAPALVDHT
ncbi:phage/plasmid primase, P4 family [Microbacterium sp. LWH10-1.2]|uniref:DNA primase family protein n=1 Tax=Microbacterium sp. LWH10-1.2 TaxID=3135255 RepID=UPI003138F36D